MKSKKEIEIKKEIIKIKNKINKLNKKINNNKINKKIKINNNLNKINKKELINLLCKLNIHKWKVIARGKKNGKEVEMRKCIHCDFKDTKVRR